MSNEYPEPICQDCGKPCDRFEEVAVAGGIDLWCYCDACGTTTFHPIPGPNDSTREE